MLTKPQSSLEMKDYLSKETSWTKMMEDKVLILDNKLCTKPWKEVWNT